MIKPYLFLLSARTDMPQFIPAIKDLILAFVI